MYFVIKWRSVVSCNSFLPSTASMYRAAQTWWQAASTDRAGLRRRTASDSRNLQGPGFSWLSSSTWNSSLGGSGLSSRGRSSRAWWEPVRSRSWKAREMCDCRAGLKLAARPLTWTNEIHEVKSLCYETWSIQLYCDRSVWCKAKIIITNL